MYPKRTNTLPARGPDRAVALIAKRANLDTIFGGAAAMVKAQRMARMRLPSADRCLDAVSSVYSASLGRVTDEFAVFECGECGQIYLGIDNAAQCCADNEYVD